MHRCDVVRKGFTRIDLDFVADNKLPVYLQVTTSCKQTHPATPTISTNPRPTTTSGKVLRITRSRTSTSGMSYDTP